MFTATKLRRYLILLAIFMGCFSLTVLIFAKLFTDSTSTVEQGITNSGPGQAKEVIFPASVSINKEGKFLKVAHSGNLIPQSKKDYLLYFWGNLKSLPEVGERLVMLSKYNGAPPKIQGFAIGLKRDSNSVRPVLFWGDGSSAGRWYDFPEINISINEWNFFALHVHKNRFVGMYTGRLVKGASPTVRFLGGHEIILDDPLNLGTSEFIFGAPEGRNFKGKLGPLAIINPLSIGFEDLANTIENYLKSPLDFSILGSSSEYQLLIEDGRKDSSGKGNLVSTSY